MSTDSTQPAGGYNAAADEDAFQARVAAEGGQAPDEGVQDPAVGVEHTPAGMS